MAHKHEELVTIVDIVLSHFFEHNLRFEVLTNYGKPLFAKVFDPDPEDFTEEFKDFHIRIDKRLIRFVVLDANHRHVILLEGFLVLPVVLKYYTHRLSNLFSVNASMLVWTEIHKMLEKILATYYL